LDGVYFDFAVRRAAVAALPKFAGILNNPILYANLGIVGQIHKKMIDFQKHYKNIL